MVELVEEILLEAVHQEAVNWEQGVM